MSHRLQWSQLPPGLHELLEAALGARVVATTPATGGYSPALACVAELEDGRRVFLKAASPAQNPRTPDLMRREAEINRALTRTGAPAPHLLDVLDDGTWVVLVFEVVAGRLPDVPWQPDQLVQVARAVRRIADVPPPPLLQAARTTFSDIFTGWSQLNAEAPTSPSSSASAPTWWQEHLGLLCALEGASVPAVAGKSFVHGDVRSDNTMLTDDGQVVFVDWTSCCVGAPWLDLVCMAPSVELEGGCRPGELLRLAGERVPVDQLTPAVAGLAGYFVRSGRLPDPPGMPTVRAAQRLKGELALRWLRELLDDA